ncbi:MAG: hypothetical protein AAGA18_15315 [Verrucomicrobiota bacterium]
MINNSVTLPAIGAGAAVLFCGFLSLPVKAENSPSLSVTPLSVVSESSALTLVFPHQEIIEMMEGGSKNITLPLAHELLDTEGNPVGRTGADVQIQLTADESNINLTATAINIGGQFVPIETSSVDMGGVSIYQDARFRQGMNNNSYLPVLGSGVGRLIAGDGDMMGPIIGFALGTAAQHLINDPSPEVAIAVQVLPGSRQTLQLDAPLVLTPTEDGRVAWSQLEPVTQEVASDDVVSEVTS